MQISSDAILSLLHFWRKNDFSKMLFFFIFIYIIFIDGNAFKVFFAFDSHEFRIGALQKDFSANKNILKIFLSVFVYALSSRTTRLENKYLTKKIFYFFSWFSQNFIFPLVSFPVAFFWVEKTI
jgi:hypothetical protein